MADFIPVYGKGAERWVEVEKSLFRDTRGRSRGWRADNDPLVHRDWAKVMVADDIHVAVGPLWLGHPEGWPQRPGLPELAHIIDPLLWCIRDLGRSEIVLSCKCGWRPRVAPAQVPAFYVRCPLDADVMHDACEFLDEQRGTSSYALRAFDASGDWCAIDGDEDEHLLAGTPEFIGQYYASAGGEDYVRAWYYHHDIMHHSHWDRETGQPSKFRSLVYDYVGWPYPVYPKTGPFAGDDIDWTPMFGDRIKSCGPGKSD